MLTALAPLKRLRILVTGHTGFKGAWLCRTLMHLGADVTGYALEPPTDPSLFGLLQLDKDMRSEIGDIRDLGRLENVFATARPDIVIHMAAQPLVRLSYYDPVTTYETNVMGTVNILECVRRSETVRSCVNVTTDKVYKNREWLWGYREDEELDGYDPYSNSKSCSELVTATYKRSFFYDRNIGISTMRAGNVIGGGDFAADRIIPDCMRAALKNEDIVVRNPHAVRPYEHVLEPIIAYLLVACRQIDDASISDSYNVGPEAEGCLSTADLVSLFCESWNEHTGASLKWVDRSDGGPHEATYLRLDCSKIKNVIGWHPKWSAAEAAAEAAAWAAVYKNGGDIRGCVDEVIKSFLG